VIDWRKLGYVGFGPYVRETRDVHNIFVRKFRGWEPKQKMDETKPAVRKLIEMVH
jgi:hypothetical protein